MNLSVKTRLTLWNSLSMGMIAFLACAFLGWSLYSIFNLRDQRVMEEKVATILALVQGRQIKGDLLQDRLTRDWGARKYERIFIRVVDRTRHVMAETPGILPEVRGIFEGIETQERPEPTFPRMATYFEKGLMFRASRAALPGQSADVIIALDRSDEARLFSLYMKHLALFMLLSLAACSLVGYRLAKEGIAPILRFTHMAAKLFPSQLHHRVDQSGLPTEFQALASQLNAMLARIDDHIKRTTQFTADIAHELRTPVNNLLGTLSLGLEHPRSAKEYRDILSSSVEECGRLRRIIESLLFMARSDQMDVPLKKEIVDVAKELRDLHEFYEAAAEERGLRLRLSGAEPCSLELERTLIQRALGNVIANAIQYVQPGGQVEIASQRTPDGVEIRIDDNGVGIAPEHLAQLFARFYRADQSRSKSSGGTGLGLAIAKTIVELHKGTIQIASEVGRGTHVRIFLPGHRGSSP